ncbi:unnamed protein product [Caenorhabditis angaria]|uniref:Uncharacterized protein n=1 Tax=Caenorhabditis angaria TaxID=860376 RepID=A0A9P1J5A0_9PELO|nr:unnamed protein product [Caenorhabditis angaria]
MAHLLHLILTVALLFAILEVDARYRVKGVNPVFAKHFKNDSQDFYNIAPDVCKQDPRFLTMYLCMGNLANGKNCAKIKNSKYIEEFLNEEANTKDFDLIFLHDVCMFSQINFKAMFDDALDYAVYVEPISELPQEAQDIRNFPYSGIVSAMMELLTTDLNAFRDVWKIYWN